ncbi:MAG: DUF480 domain-containing protein [Lentisphaeria bacterium]
MTVDEAASEMIPATPGAGEPVAPAAVPPGTGAPLLTPEEARVLGSLVEKQLTTPDYYPLTLNALVAACNQKNNRDPVVEYDERTVVRALDGLRGKKLAWLTSPAGTRVAKYEHRLHESRPCVGRPELALLGVLLLRGAQTLGELRTRTERMHPFPTLEAAEDTLQRLIVRDEPLVARLPRLPGHKECRFVHLFCGPPEMAPLLAPPPEPARLALAAEDARLAALEAQVASLREELAALRAEFAQFKAQFG